MSDTILSIRPGILVETGERGQVKANLALRNAFTHAIDGTSGNESLLSGEAGFSYSGARTKYSLGFNYDQSNQNNRDVIVDGRREVFRTNSLVANSHFEYQFTAKSSAGVGLDFWDTRYPGGSLINNRSWEVPVNYYYALTPKLDLTSGVSLRKTTASGSDRDSKSTYYNVGLRGELTPTITGNLSAGYRSLRPSVGDSESLLGFQGSVSMAVAAKSALNFAIGRDFKTSAQGQSLKSGAYSISFSNQTTLVWRNTVSLSYNTIDYGPTLFSAVTGNVGRVDKYLEFGGSTSYVWNSWLQSGLSLSYRNNHSTFSGVEFNGWIVALQVGASY
ncbi:outer membrane beta-barrel protein [Nibricoccus sp. IMCC34717]|uniref:outer membrane beta-barrel protein n=1 Tax=Nibricoccus sp. IMCC34717 TaxID=3034021 RepID=UPI00384E1285